MAPALHLVKWRRTRRWDVASGTTERTARCPGGGTTAARAARLHTTSDITHRGSYEDRFPLLAGAQADSSTWIVLRASVLSLLARPRHPLIARLIRALTSERRQRRRP